MKTNYSYWEKFDVDKALDDADLKAEMEDRGKDYASLLEQQSKDAKRVQIEAQQAVDALRSKVSLCYFELH